MKSSKFSPLEQEMILKTVNNYFNMHNLALIKGKYYFENYKNSTSDLIKLFVELTERIRHLRDPKNKQCVICGCSLLEKRSTDNKNDYYIHDPLMKVNGDYICDQCAIEDQYNTLNHLEYLIDGLEIKSIERDVYYNNECLGSDDTLTAYDVIDDLCAIGAIKTQYEFSNDR